MWLVLWLLSSLVQWSSPWRKLFGSSAEPALPIPRRQFLRLETLENRIVPVTYQGGTDSWMSQLPDYLSLSQLSMPGTHDTMTYGVAGVFVPTVQTQTMSLDDQLNSGIRFIDIRLGGNLLSGNDLWCYHGSINLLISFNSQVVQRCEAFLQSHPGETIVMSIKNDDTSSDNVTTAVSNHVNGGDRNFWYTKTSIPTLKEARGKIVILNRWNDTVGIHTGGWPSNTTGSAGANNDPLYVEDHYAFSGSSLFDAITGKTTDTEQALDSAAAWNPLTTPPDTRPTWFITSSCASANDFGQFLLGFGPQAFAYQGTPKIYVDGHFPFFHSAHVDGLDPVLRDRFNTPKAEHIGTLLMDFPDQTLLNEVIGANWPVVSLAALPSPVYGQQSTVTAVVSAGPTNFAPQPNDTVGLSVDGKSGGTASASVGAASITIPPLAAGQHTIQVAYFSSGNSSGWANGTLNVAPAPLTIRVDDQKKLYGQPNPTLSASYSGFVNGDTPASLSGSLNLSTTATTGSGVGTYPITASGTLSSPNYSISYAAGTLGIDPVELTIVPNDVERPFGQPNPPLTASLVGLVNGDTPAVVSGLTRSTTATSDSRQGDYPITASGARAVNYQIDYGEGKLTVTEDSPGNQTVTPIPGVTISWDSSNVTSVTDRVTGTTTLTGRARLTGPAGISCWLLLGGTAADGTRTQGLVLQEGQVQSLNAVVDGGIAVAGVKFQANSLIIAYDRTNASLTVTGEASFSLTDADGIAVKFGGTTANGSTRTRGLVLQNNALQNLDMTVTGGFKLGKVSFSADALTIRYNPATSTFAMTGGATTTFTLPNRSNVSLGVNLGGSLETSGVPTQGLVIANQRLQTLTASVNAGFTIDGVMFTAGDLTFSYDPSSSTFSLTGSAGVVLQHSSISVKLGGAGPSHGLQVRNGRLTNLDMDVSGNFNLFGVTLQTKALGFSYQPEQNRFAMYGTLGFSTAKQGDTGSVFANVDASLGDLNDPGLLVENGTLTRFDLLTNAKVNLFGLTVEANQLGIDYSAASDNLQLTGGVTFTSLFSASAQLPNGGITINTKTGAVQVNGVVVTLSDLSLGKFGIQNFKVHFTQTPQSTSFGASLSMEFPTGFAIGGSIDFIRNANTHGLFLPNDIALSYQVTTGEGIPIGDTGAFITSLSGMVRNLTEIRQGNLVVGGSIAVTLGPTVAGVSLVSVEGGFQIDKTMLSLDGTVTVGNGGAIKGQDKLTINWANKMVSNEASLTVFSAFRFSGFFNVNAQGTLVIYATASVTFPQVDSLPFPLKQIYADTLAGKTIGSANFFLKVAFVDNRPRIDAAGWVDYHLGLLGSGKVGIAYLDSKFQVIRNNGIDDLLAQNHLSQADHPAAANSGDAGPSLTAHPVPSAAVVVPAGVDSVSLAANFESPRPTAPAFTISGPAGVAEYLYANGQPVLTRGTAPYQLAVALSSSTQLAVQLSGSLAPGTYQLQVLDPLLGAGLQQTSSGTFNYRPATVQTPTFTLQGDSLESVTATGTVSQALAGEVSVELVTVVSTSDPGENRHLGTATVASGNLTVDADGSFRATLSPSVTLPPGTWTVQAVVQDSINPPTSSPLSSPFTIVPGVQGTVTTGGTPLADAPVVVSFTRGHLQLTETVHTDEQGHYAVAGPHDGGTWAVSVSVANPGDFGISGISANSGSFVLADGQTAKLDLNVTAAPSLRGTVRSFTRYGKPVQMPGVTVFLDIVGNGQLDPSDRVAVTDSQGAYHFFNLPVGGYTVVAVAPDGFVLQGSATRHAALAGSTHATGVDFRLSSTDTSVPSSRIGEAMLHTELGTIYVGQIAGDADSNGTGKLHLVQVSIQDQVTGQYWNGSAFVTSATPLSIDAQGTTTWTLPLPEAALTDGHGYTVLAQAVNENGNTQASPTSATFTYSAFSGHTANQMVQPGSAGISTTDLTQRGNDIVRRIYLELLNREPDPAAQFWVQGYIKGTFSEQQIASAVYHSSEGLAVVIMDDYVTYLNRMPDPLGMSYFSGLLNAGASNFDVIQILLSSQEYTSRFTTPDLLVNDLSVKLLGHSAPLGSAVQEYWRLQLQNGMSVGDVVRGFLGSEEHLDYVVVTAYDRYLARSTVGDPGAVYSVGVLKNNKDGEAQLVIGLVTSSEAFSS